MNAIGIRERLEIIKRHKADDLPLEEIWGLINRALAFKSSREFAGLLIQFFNERNDQLDEAEGLI